MVGAWLVRTCLSESLYFFFSSSAGFGGGILKDSGRVFSPSPTISHGLVDSKLLEYCARAQLSTSFQKLLELGQTGKLV